MADARVKPTIRRRRIIARPRLIAALDRSRARVRMLVASAGYGKTILAEQWAAREGVRVAWVRARRPSADVAVLARDLAAAGAEIVPGCERRLCERLNATTDPAEEVTVLAEMLAEDLTGWPDDAWIAIDDYHHVCASGTAESFVETVVQRSPVRLLIATRQRPSWVSTRSVLYGDVLEIGQTALAMREDEVDQVLAGVRDGMSPGLLALAGGWPAVIGLASLTSSPVDTDVEMPDQLYEFFAEEVYRSLEPAVRTGLRLLAVAPSLDRDLAGALLGSERAQSICAEGLSLGILEERGGRLELHPLAAAFLEARARHDSRQELVATAAAAVAVYRARREWDAAFDVIEKYDLADLDTLLEESLEEMLNNGRLATVSAWVERAELKHINAPIVRIAQAEVDLRHGLHMKAQAEALSVAPQTKPKSHNRFRALEVGARAAHVGSREVDALELYREAARNAPDSRCERRALWGQVMCAAALELDEAHELLSALELTAPRYDCQELVRMADKQLGLGYRFGFIRHLSDARGVAELVSSVHDPFVRCSFRSMFSWALILGGYYAEAHDQATAWLEDAKEFRVDVAVSHGHAMLGYALAGLHRYPEAYESLECAAEMARRFNDGFAIQNEYALRVRVLLQQGRSAEACAIEPPDLSHALKGMEGEVLASRGLALACLGRLDEALSLGRHAIATTQGIETRVLCPAIEAVVALKARSSRVVDSAERLVDVAFETGGVDLLITAYRSSHDLLAVLFNSGRVRERAVFAVGRAGDEAIADGLGLVAVDQLDPRESLSVREREVYGLLCEGLSNRDIAARLFISESTVKVHVHHVFDKLGIRSRTALALNAARERARQAASTATLGDASSSMG